MRTSSRSFGSKSTRSSSLVAVWSRWPMALANAAAWESKSSRTGIVTAASAGGDVVMPPRSPALGPGRGSIYMEKTWGKPQAPPPGCGAAPGAAGTDPPEAAGGPAEPPRYSLRPGLPDLSAFPRAAWLAAARRAVSAAPSDAFGYADPRGRPELRAALAVYLARARGVRALADQIVICSGFTQALSLLGRVLAARGAASVAVEAYGHQHHRDVIQASGLSPRPIPVDDDGAVIDQISDAGAVLLTPSHQLPLGIPLAPPRPAQAR